MHTYWDTYFNNIINWENEYNIIHKFNDNRVKQFKLKLIHKIIPSKEVRFTWKIASDQLCNTCQVKENYKHLFIDCKEITIFWQKINEMFTHCGISNNMNTLKHIVIGYKINSPEYFVINEILAIIGFSIYKTYFISESRLKKVDIF